MRRSVPVVLQDCVRNLKRCAPFPNDGALSILCVAAETCRNSRTWHHAVPAWNRPEFSDSTCSPDPLLEFPLPEAYLAFQTDDFMV